MQADARDALQSYRPLRLDEVTSVSLPSMELRLVSGAGGNLLSG